MSMNSKNEDCILFSVILVILLCVQEVDCITLQQGSSQYRSCPSGFYLDITSGIWRCIGSWPCYSSLSVNKRMDSQCNYGTSCTIYANSSWLGGDPCSTCSKQLEWYDTCRSIWGNWGAWSSCPYDCTTQSVFRNKTCIKPNGGCGLSPSIFTSCLSIGCSSSTEISITTPGDNTYYSLISKCFLAIERTSFTFRARANNGLYLALASRDCVNCGSAHYEILLGGQYNTISKIRFGVNWNDCDSLSKVILNQKYFDTFWVSWTGGVVRVGTGSTINRNILMSCSHSTPYDIKYVMIRTGWGSSGEWRFPNDVACTHETTKSVKVITDNTSCHGVSHYACTFPYIPVDGNTQRTCGIGKVWTGKPLICSKSEQKPSTTWSVIFVVIASVIPGTAIFCIAVYYMCKGLKGAKNKENQNSERTSPSSCSQYDEIEGPDEVHKYENVPTDQDGFDMRPVYEISKLEVEDNEYDEISSERASVAAVSNPGITEYENIYLNLNEGN